MFEATQERPFADLPAALVEEVLECTEDVGRALLDSFREMRQQRAVWRTELEAVSLLQHESEALRDQERAPALRDAWRA